MLLLEQKLYYSVCALMVWSEIFIIVLAGFAAGFVNTVAGGGSLIALSALIFIGLPPMVANGSNRIAVFAQCIFGVWGFKSKGVSSFKFSFWLGLSALAGAALGAKIAVGIDGILFNKLLAVIMLVIVVLVIFKPGPKVVEAAERLDQKHRAISLALFFLISGIRDIFLAVSCFVSRVQFVYAQK